MTRWGLWSRPWWQVMLLFLPGNTLIAVVLWLASPRSFFDYWVVSNCVGYGICLTDMALAHVLQARRWLPVVAVLGVVLGAPLGLWVASQIGSAELRQFLLAHRSETLRFTAIGVVCGMTFGLLWHSLLRVRELEMRQRESALREAQQQKQALEAHLKLLQAQIEPHFLFNTLANLHSLIESDAPRARHLLEQLNQYLRASLVHSRAGRATLGDECRLLEAYLAIQQVRLGERLTYRLEIDDSLRSLSFPPMLLQPLVENALCHGIEPSIDGGEVLLQAERSNAGLCLRICDTGIGFAAASAGSGGQGVGLSNIRERLHTLYGPQARLDIMDNQPRGVCAELWIPECAL